MIKQGILNFLKNLKFCFTSLGTLFLGLLFGVCFLYSGMKTQIAQASNDIQTITAEYNFDVEDIKNCVVETFSTLSWDDPVQTIKTVTSKEWLDGTLNVNLENAIENYKLCAFDIEKAVKKAVSGYVKYIVAFAICIVFGLVGGFLLTRYFIRKSLTKTNMLKFILFTILDGVLFVGVTALCLWLTFKWRPSAIVGSAIGIILYGMITLLEAYVIHGIKRVPFKKAVNIKNALLLFATNLIIYVFAFAISGIAVAVTNAFIGIFIALPLLIIAINVISLNAESYILSLKSTAALKQKKIKSVPAEEK